MTRPSRSRRFLPPIAGGAPPTGWEALEKWVSPSEGGGGEAAAAAPSGKTGWEALDKWVPGGDKGGDSAQSQAAELKDDLAKLREDLPDVGGSTEKKGFWASLKRFFGGK